MTVRRRPLVHDGPGGRFAGTFAWDDAVAGPRPGILVVPNVLGQKAADDDVAAELAALGYAAFACDVFGEGRRTVRGPDQARYMAPLDADRALLRDRLAASLSALAGEDEVDDASLAAIGFCFGGKCVLDMARAGLPIRAGVSLHGVYDPPSWPLAAPIATRLLICHGWDDPLGPPDAVAALAAELTGAGADWQLLAHGHAGHAFTDRAVPKGDNGFGYDPAADRRSRAALVALLAETFAA